MTRHLLETAARRAGQRFVESLPHAQKVTDGAVLACVVPSSAKAGEDAARQVSCYTVLLCPLNHGNAATHTTRARDTPHGHTIVAARGRVGEAPSAARPRHEGRQGGQEAQQGG